MRRWIRSVFTRPTRQPLRCIRPSLVRLEDRTVPAVNLLVSGNQGTAQFLHEFTPTGDMVRAVAIPTNGEGAHEARDLIAGSDGLIHVYNGTVTPKLAAYDGTDWTQTSFTGWSTASTTGYGGIARYQNYVFATDMRLSGESNSHKGIVRFNLSNGTATRFATSNDYIDVTVGRDNLVYALTTTNGRVLVFSPTSMNQIRTVNLPTSPGGQAASYRAVTANAAGQLFAVTWEGRVLKFSSTGTLQGSVTLNGPAPGPTFANPMDIDLSGDGRVAVGSASGHVVQLNESLSNVTYFHVGPGGSSAFVAFALTDYNTPPRITLHFPDHVGVAINTSSFDLMVRVEDDQTAAAGLVLTATSNNQALLPNSAISLFGTDDERFVIVTPTPDLTGTATVTLTVTDAQGGTATATFIVDVSHPPTLSDMIDVTLPADTPTAIPFTIGDVETPPEWLSVGVGWVSSPLLPSGGVFVIGSGANRTLKLNPGAGQVGSVTLTMTVYDLHGVFTSDTFVVTFAHTPPSVSDVGDVTVPYGGSAGPLAFTVGDIQTAAGDLSVSASSSNPTLLPLSGIVFGGSGADRTVTVTPAAGQVGSSTVTLTVTDAGGLTATDTFVVTVANTTPTISDVADVAVAFNGSSGAIAFTVGDGETPADLTVTAATSNGTLLPLSGIELSGTGSNRTVTVTPSAGQAGTVTVTLTVTDLHGATATDSFVVTVNAPPSISDVGDLTVPTGGTAGPLAFTVGDSETPAADLTVTVASSSSTLLPLSGITLGGSGTDRTVTVSPAAGQWGTATVTLTVTDAGGATATDTFVLTVPNTAPTISDVSDAPVPYGGSVGPIAFTIGDAQAGDLTVTASSSNTTLLPLDGITLGGSGADRTVTVTPAAGQFGSAVVTLTVTDGGGLTATDTFIVSVTNTGPTISDVADRIIHVGGTTGAIPFTIGDAQTPAGDLTVTFESSNGVMFPPDGIVLGGSGADRTITVTPYSFYFGWTTITLTVTDAQGLTATDTFEVRVNTPVITITDVSHVEGNSGTTEYVFTLSMSPVSEIPVTVNYTTANVTATAGSDYTATSGTVTFAPGETTQTVTVLVNGDTTEEANETFRLNLSGAQGAIVGDSFAVGTITNDDTNPRISIGDVTAYEGHAGTTAFVFTVTLSEAAFETVTVNYATANGLAVAGSDYTAASGTLTFAAGETTQTVTVLVNGERFAEQDESFLVSLSNAAGAIIGDGQAFGTIRNDDGSQEFWVSAWGQYTEYFNVAPTVQNGGAYVDTFHTDTPLILTGGPSPRETRGLLEFNIGSLTANDIGAAVLEFTETYFYELSQPVQIYGYSGDGSITLADGTAEGVLLGSFDPLAGTGRRWVTLDRDALVGLLGSGSIGIRLVTTPNSQARIAAQTTGSPPKLVLLPAPFAVPQISVSDAQATEGDLEFGQPVNEHGLFFTVTLSEPTEVPVTVYYTTTAGTATEGDDFDGTPWQVTLYPGWTQTTIYVPVTCDNVLEGTESMTLRIHNAMYATLGDTEAVGTIFDNDAAPIANAGPDITIPAGSWVFFDGTDSIYNPYGNVQETWTYSDGGSGQGIIPPQRQYMFVGTYTVTLTIADADRGTSTDTLTVTVMGTQMGVQFGGPTAAVAHQDRTYSFTVYGLDGQPYNGTYNLQVNWGDGQVSNYNQNTFNRPTVSIAHTYTYFSNFNVTVQVSATGQGGSGGGQVAVAPTLLESGTLYIGDGNGSASLTLSPAGDTGGIQVTHFSSNWGAYANVNRVVVFGGVGMDVVRIVTTTVNSVTYAITQPVIVFGGNNDDRLEAMGAGASVALIGGGGRDTLTGGAFDDILIGGWETDTLNGGGGSDILIGGGTNYDLDPTAQTALLAEWSRIEVPLQTRYDRIRGVQSGGLNGTYRLWSPTVQNDNAVDSLWGNGGVDWFFTHSTDQRRDFETGEFWTML